MTNVLDASFLNNGPRTDLKKFSVRQKFGNHTVAFLDYRFFDRHEYVLPVEGSPISVRWGKTPLGVRNFYGYVNHYETDEERRAYTRLVALGTSRVMNSASPSTWQETSRSSIARDIAKRHKLRSIIHQHFWVVDNWATGPRTDWQALNDLANEIGYLLWVDGSTFYFLDPKKALASASSLTVPFISSRDIEKVQILGGSNIPGETTQAKRRVLYGLDYSTNEPFLATSGDPSHPTEVVADNVTTFAEAEQATDAASRREGDYYVAKIRMKGDATLYPGRIIRLDSGRVNTDQTGLWTINEARHEITRDDFTTDLVATRGVDSKPLARVATTVRGASEQVAAVVRDGTTWEAALQEHVNV